MAALDYLTDRSFTALRSGIRVRVSPALKLTEEVGRYVKRDQLALLVELEAGDAPT